MIQILITSIILAGVAVYMAIKIYRLIRKPQASQPDPCGGCGSSCETCPWGSEFAQKKGPITLSSDPKSTSPAHNK